MVGVLAVDHLIVSADKNFTQVGARRVTR